MDIVGKALEKSKREIKSYESDTLFGVSRDFFESDLSLDEKFIKRSDSTFFFRLSSDVMAPVIGKNDLLVVDTSLQLFHKGIGAFYLNGKPLCRQFLKTPSGLVLHAFNDKDIILREDDEFELFGIVTISIRSFV